MNAHIFAAFADELEKIGSTAGARKSRWWFLDAHGNPASKTWLKRTRNEAIAAGEHVTAAGGDFARPWEAGGSHVHLDPLRKGAERIEGVHHFGTLRQARASLRDALHGAAKIADVEYRGKTFPGYNQPIPSDQKDKKMMVLAKKGDEVRLLHFGQKGYQHNYSPEAKANYLKRSAGIRNKDGELTMNDRFSPNYWARKVLWPKGETGDGKNGPIDTDVRVSRK